jgi:transposase
MYAQVSGGVRTKPIKRVSNTTGSGMDLANAPSSLSGLGIMCIYMLTYVRGVVYSVCMTIPAALKKKALLTSGTLNPHPEAVKSKLFQLEFFDPYDRAQVKYELLRTCGVDEETVTEACRQFGFSRESFYQIQRAFSEQGFSSLIPEKRGRKGPTKLKGEVLDFALEKKKQNPDMDPSQLAALIAERYGMQIHRTTVLRGMKKKLRSQAQLGRKRIHRKRRPGASNL